MGQIEKIKDLFFENPSREFYLREISKITNVPKTTVQRILLELKGKELITKIKTKPYPKYRANTENFYYRYYKKTSIIEKIYKSGLIDYLIEERNPSIIILFGSCAKGEYDIKSDIDLFLGANENKIDLNEYEKKLKHKINIIFEQNLGDLNTELRNNIINGEKLYGFIKINHLNISFSHS
ncbi:MAG: nucleotidyltransferase domain-containing protein [Nanoarchaeota archaeon]